MSRVGSRLGYSFATYVVLLIGVVAATTVILQKQKDDGVVVNLSGRQRMLSQRMTHQLLTYASRIDAGIDAQDARERVLTTTRVFEATLDALDRGGPAPLDLHMATFRALPTASSNVAYRIGRVRRVYATYRSSAHAILDGTPDERAAGLRGIVGSETELLAELDAVVTLLQGEAESKVSSLVVVQITATVLSLLLTFVLLRWVRSGVTEPLEKLRDAAEDMSLGNLTRPVPVGGAAELHSLGESVERVRMSLRALLATKQTDDVTSEMAGW